jgi:hypothetical protein
MRFLFLIIPFIFMQNCSKPKTVLICGDHICINKSEANQYFKENLSIEVKIIDIKKNINPDLVELNLNESIGNRKISINKKEKTKKEIKTLTNEQIKNIKKKLKKNQRNNKIAKKTTYNNKNKSKKITRKKVKKESLNKDKNKLNNNNIKNQLKVVDVCSIIDKCDIDEISKFLLNQAKKKKFPDITVRE